MFEGFSPQTFTFLKQLKTNNNRDWFAENKSRYEAVVMEPALALVEDMQSPLEKIAPAFTAVPKRSGGSIMRIYRDVRFSKNKLPFKTNLGIQFRHEFGKDVHAPGFYFHLAADEIFFGAGIWRPANPTLNQIRALIDDDPQRWKRTVNRKPFREAFERRGESLKRGPRDYDQDHPLIDELKLKDHIGICILDRADVLDRDLIKVLSQRMKIAMPYMRFLCDALRLPC